MMFRHSLRLISSLCIRNIHSRNIGWISGCHPMMPVKVNTFRNKDTMLLIRQDHIVFPKPKTEAEIKEIIVRVCKEFDKIPADKFTLEGKFMENFGMDSLDHVELIMALEDEFEFEIPVQDSEKMKTANDIVAYISLYFKNHTNITI